MSKKSNICIKLLTEHIKSKPGLYKSFNFNYHTQKYKLKDILNEIIYIMRTGISYRMLRSKIKWQTIYKVYRKLVKNNIFKMTYLEMLNKYLKRGGLHKKLKYVHTDTTFIINKNGRDKTGLNKYYYKKKGNKVSIIIDSNGYVLDMNIFKGGKNDIKILENHLKNRFAISDDHYNKFKGYFICDAGYDSKLIHSKLRENGFKPLIEQNRRGIKNKNLIRRMSKSEYKIYCKRVKVENVFCRLKQLRRLNQRYDGLCNVFKAYIYLGIIYMSC